MCHAHRRARESVSEPKEGTILSIIEAWAAALSQRAREAHGFTELIGSSREILKRSLAQTTERLPELKEAVVRGEDLRLEAVRRALSGCGDCLIVAGGLRRMKIHVHADDSSGVMGRPSPFGVVAGQKADDMLLQYRDAHERKSKVAIVTDSSCDLSSELIDRFGIHVVPFYILAEGSEYLDKLTIGPEPLRGLSEGKGSFPRTSQPSGPSFTRLFSTLLSHYEEVLAIHLSSAMSGTLAASRKEAEEAGSRARVVDSRHLSGSLDLIVLRAAESARQGMDAASITARPEDWSGIARIIVAMVVEGHGKRPLKMNPALPAFLNADFWVSATTSMAKPRIYSAVPAVSQIPNPLAAAGEEAEATTGRVMTAAAKAAKRNGFICLSRYGIRR